MGSTRSSGVLAQDYPVDNASLPKTIALVDAQAIRGELSGAGLAQATDSIGTALDALAEACSAPTLAFTGTAGTTTRAYAVIRQYAVAQSVPGTPTEGALPGIPLEGRGPLGLARGYRLGKISASASIANTAATLDKNDYVTITVPNDATHAATAPTYAVIAVDGSGNPLYTVAVGVAAGGTATDKGVPLYGSSDANSTHPVLPKHAEVGYIPAGQATAKVTVGGTFNAGDKLHVAVNGTDYEHTVAAGDTNLAGVATALAAAITPTGMSAAASGDVITITVTAAGKAGNTNEVAVLVEAGGLATLTITQPFEGGCDAAMQNGPRTLASYESGN